MKICPCCGKELIPKRVLNFYGGYIEIDLCPNCSGVWFDKWELTYLNPKSVDQIVINQSSIKCKPTACPVDNTPLSLLKDLLIPKEIDIYYCPTCFGMWVSSSALTTYANYRLEKLEKQARQTKEIAQLEEKINKLLELEKLKEPTLEDYENKIANFVSIVITILRILSHFIK